jgi:citrate lyase subunit beta/citryl-CoA lyase
LRLSIVISSHLAGLAAPIDGVTTSIKESNQTLEDSRRSRRLGFGGKMCIHPLQISIVNENLAPSKVEMTWAKSVLDAYATRDAGAFELYGKMIDEPVLRKARSLLGR